LIDYIRGDRLRARFGEEEEEEEEEEEITTMKCVKFFWLLFTR